MQKDVHLLYKLCQHGVPEPDCEKVTAYYPLPHSIGRGKSWIKLCSITSYTYLVDVKYHSCE